MDDKTVLSHIDELMAEEHRLRDRRQAGELSSEEEQARLREVEVSLDQCWDLLRRRRAARDQGGDPDSVEPRSPSQVESYLQ
ncbi:MAG TPA: DUF2630 family protein [Pilimelia sp.]|nr:DUF2630 family protein [Pilimelia sp.]